MLITGLVFVIAGGHIFGTVHSKPPAIKSVRVLRSKGMAQNSEGMGLLELPVIIY